jgi:predicted O-methyltransferase YrrM
MNTQQLKLHSNKRKFTKRKFKHNKFKKYNNNYNNNNKSVRNKHISAKYKEDLALLSKYVNNDTIYDFIRNWGVTLNGRRFTLGSNINVHEGVFVTLLLKNSIKPSTKVFNVVEVGFAFGTSSMYINNALNVLEDRANVKHTIIDPNQDKQWGFVGLYNVYRMKKPFIETEWIKDFSDKAFNIIKKYRKTKYDIAFVDGGHSYDIVMQDCKDVDVILKKGGLVIHDDVLHSDITKVIKEYYVGNKSYEKVKIEIKINKDGKETSKIVVDKEGCFPANIDKTKSFTNSKTMYAFRKLS